MRPTAPAEHALELVPYFHRLRPDERVRIAQRVQTFTLETGREAPLATEDPALFVVVQGEVSLQRPGFDAVSLFAGDRVLEPAVVMESKPGRGGSLKALEPALVALIPRSLLRTLLAEFPVISLPLVAELGSELKWRNDLLREVMLARAQRLPEPQLAALLHGRRNHLQRFRQRESRHLGELAWQTLVREPAARPAFWVFLGAVMALVSARTVVAYILKNGLQKQLFAIIGGGGGIYHPIHVHHFNYGLLLVMVTGLCSLIPGARRVLRLLCFTFGFGMGLVVDEFALLWNLDPNYYQVSSRVAAALVVFALAQGVYLRGFYLTLGKRLRAAGRRA